MPVNYPGIPSIHFTQAETGMPDLGAAIRSGFNTYSQGVEAAYKPKNLAEKLLAMQLENKINKPKAEHAEELTLADLASKHAEAGLAPYRQQLLQAQIQKAMRGPSPVLGNYEKALQGVSRIEQQYGKDSAEAKEARSYASRLAQGTQGVSVFTDPESGQSYVQVGGSGGKGGNIGGKTFMNPVTGESVSIPGTVATNKLQNRIIAEEQLRPVFDQIIENVPQFQSGWKQLERDIAGTRNKWFGGESNLPSQFASGKAALSKSAESLVGLFGLNATTRNVQEAKNILEPVEGESPSGYKNRVINEMTQFAKSKGISTDILKHGIKLDDNKNSNLTDEESLILQKHSLEDLQKKLSEKRKGGKK